MPELAADCPFCTLPSSRIIREDSLCWVIRDGYPVSPGHSLIIPKRHIASWFDLTEEESASLLRQLSEAKTALDAKFKPDGYNIGINEGAAAGQTVFHLHVHLIPRYHGDTADPRGGVRWIIPDKASYYDGVLTRQDLWKSIKRFSRLLHPIAQSIQNTHHESLIGLGKAFQNQALIQRDYPVDTHPTIQRQST
jgi:diadenosine tetraphosphate (Ap4A) HIT family hydrolase